jgi:hypothetical protein
VMVGRTAKTEPQALWLEGRRTFSTKFAKSQGDFLQVKIKFVKSQGEICKNFLQILQKTDKNA